MKLSIPSFPGSEIIQFANEKLVRAINSVQQKVNSIAIAALVLVTGYCVFYFLYKKMSAKELSGEGDKASELFQNTV